MSNLTDELTKLADLRERGVLTNEEFDAQKAQLLSGATAPASPPPPPPSPSPSLQPEPAAQPAPAAAASTAPSPRASVLHSVLTAPAASSPTPPQGHADEQLMRTFIGPNADYYLGKWRTMEAQNKPYSWNWAAFLLSIYWMTYRKMFQPALIAVGAIMLLVIVGMVVPAIAPLTNMLVLAVAAGIGWRGNTLYREHVGRTLARIEVVNPDPQARLATAHSQGGVSMPAALGLVAVWLVVVGSLSYLQVLRAQRALAATADSGFASSPGVAPAAPSAAAPSATPGAPAAPAGSAYPAATPAPAGGEWVIGQWGPVGSPPCTSWIRLGPDHSITDNAGGSGTWSLTPGYGGADTLVMTVAGQAPSSGAVARGPGNTMVMGTAPRTVTWQPEQC